jgi:hypothetical protein
LSWYLEALKKYAVFSGRSRRREYWYFVLFNIIVGIVLGWIDALLGTRGSYAGAGLLSGIYSPGGPHPYFGRDRKEAPRHRSLGLVDTDRFGATDRSDSALGVRLAGRHAGRQPVWPEPERGHSQGGLRSVVRRTHPSAWKGYSANFALTAFSEVQCSLSALEHIHDPQIGVCCVCYVASWRRVKAQDSYLPFQHS